MKNKFNLNNTVRISEHGEEYKIVGMHLDTYNKPKKYGTKFIVYPMVILVWLQKML